jgi:hypothetical protein
VVGGGESVLGEIVYDSVEVRVNLVDPLQAAFDCRAA